MHRNRIIELWQGGHALRLMRESAPNYTFPYVRLDYMSLCHIGLSLVSVFSRKVTSQYAIVGDVRVDCLIPQ
jgi:hypothetical protein